MIVVRPAKDIVTTGLEALAAQAESEGIGIVTAVIRRWGSGEEKFDRPGESIVAAMVDSHAVGIGGLTHCPTTPGALRVRRFYVHPAWRRRGVAREMATHLLAQGTSDGVLITCNAGASAAAAPFWESLGFVACDMPGITHVLRDGAAAA